MRLKGKNVLVTGGANGIGRALVEGFLGEGASVVFSYLNDRDSAECVVAQAPEQVSALQCNLGDRQQARELVRSAIHTLGSIDVMVNNVGAFSRHAFVDLTDAALDEVMQVNLHSPFLMTQAVARHMIEHGTRGSLIHISSLSAVRARSRMVHYQASKAGLNAFSEGVAFELGEYGIRSNVISPGLTATKANSDQHGTETWQRRSCGIPLARTGVPQDYVGAAVFLASAESAWITGANLMVDGGMSTF